MTTETVDKLILLMPEQEADYFAQRLAHVRPELQTSIASDKAMLEALFAKAPTSVSLFGFLTDVIVPEAMLSQLDQALNIHPGPPWMPGYRPTKTLLKTGQRAYGVTLHAMARDVDTGPIIAVRRFQVPQRATLELIETMAYQHSLQLALDNLDLIAGHKKPIFHPTERWGKQ
ncbi:formyltransferase family protein [Cohaesibacter intestini]|uniref:formyltransferase family protein n=1 Tax=Cohaesibacter intestini TaxID=2211145 RepID=UPI000DE99797|nr:formyltransferase family protein [Cohaesibacter intestini]